MLIILIGAAIIVSVMAELTVDLLRDALYENERQMNSALRSASGR